MFFSNSESNPLTNFFLLSNHPSHARDLKNKKLIIIYLFTCFSLPTRTNRQSSSSSKKSLIFFLSEIYAGSKTLPDWERIKDKRGIIKQQKRENFLSFISFHFIFTILINQECFWWRWLVNDYWKSIIIANANIILDKWWYKNYCCRHAELRTREGQTCINLFFPI